MVKILSFAFVVFIAFDLEAIGRCFDRFPERIYFDALELFRKIHRESRRTGDSQNAIALHELIFKGFEEEAAEKITTGVDRKLMMKAAVGTYSLTAAHVAAMVQDVNALSWLHRNNATMEALAHRRFTPAHFAALGRNRDCLEYLFSLNVDPTKQNLYGATPDQLFKLTHLGHPNELKPYFYCYFSGTVHSHSGEDFCMFTGGAYFADSIKQTPEKVLETLVEKFEAIELKAAWEITSRVDSFRPFWFNLYLKSLKAPKLNTLVYRDDFRLHANKNFEPGEVVEIYAGLYEPEKNSVNADISGTAVDIYAGYLAFASPRGLPNVVFVKFFNRLGVSQGHYAMAIRPVRAHDMIIREQINGDLETEVEPEIEPQKLDEIIRVTSLSQMAASKGNSFDIADIRNRAISKYLLDNQNALIRLLAERKVSGADLRTFIAAYGGGKYLNNIVIDKIDSLCTSHLVAKFIAEKARSGHARSLIKAIGLPAFSMVTTELELEILWRLQA